MPTITGPLMSVSASGSLANLITYRFSKKGFTGVKHSKPTGQPSAAQLSVRAITKQVAKAWESVTEPQRITWESLASDNKYSQFNAFFVYNFQRVKNGQEITNVYPPVAPPTVAPLYVSGDGKPDVNGTYNYLFESDDNHVWKHTSKDAYIFYILDQGFWHIASWFNGDQPWDFDYMCYSGGPTGEYNGDDGDVNVSETL